MANTAYWHMYLAQPTDEQIHEFILNQFVVLWHEYDVARKLVPEGNLAEVAYADLAANPIPTMRSIYQRLSLGGFEERMKEVVAANFQRPQVKGHKVNAFGEMPPELRKVVAERWADYARAWGYEWGPTG